jgi:uncharacterized protein with ATP-grasp and redox domains
VTPAQTKPDRATRAARASLERKVPRAIVAAVTESVRRNRIDFGIATTEGTVEQVLALLARHGFVVVDVDELEELLELCPVNE